MKTLFVLLGLWIGLGTAAGQAATVFGRYVGLLRHESLKREQLAKLDLIASREEGNVIHLKAVLTLHFGDFRSGEYISYHFDNVQFNVLTQAFVFDQGDQMATLVGKQISPNEFQGDFRTSFSGEVLKLTLRNDQSPKPTLPLVEPVWGEYKGTCESRVYGANTPTTIQLYTYRTATDNQRTSNPYDAYNVRGFIGETDRKGPCGLSKKDTECVWGNLKSGTYNFYKNKLALFGDFRTLNCTTTTDGLSCNGCGPLKRVSGEAAPARDFQPVKIQDVFSVAKKEEEPALKGESAAIQGEYTGYLHHEYLDSYQHASLNILTYQGVPEAGKPATLRLSAIASLVFGSDAKSPEVLAYRFKERSYPNPLTLPQFVLGNPESDVDAILQITWIGNGVVKGHWYSQLFGRVGTFELRKDGAVPLPARAAVFESINGGYQSTDWEIGVRVGLGRSEPNSLNPFSPLTLEGWAILPDITPRRRFTGGTFDFYTGRIALEQEAHVFIGQRNARKRLQLKRMHLASMAPMPAHELMPFRLVDDEE